MLLHMLTCDEDRFAAFPVSRLVGNVFLHPPLAVGLTGLTLQFIMNVFLFTTRQEDRQGDIKQC